MDDSLKGYVKVEKDGDLLRMGSRLERETRTGERVLVGLDTESTCDWIRKLRGQYVRESPRVISEDLNSYLDNKITGKIAGNYVVMPRADTYAKGVHALRTACQNDSGSRQPTFVREGGKRIYRQLTFRENLAARLQNESLFDKWLFSCTGIAYKKNSTKFKIIPRCKELIEIPSDFNKSYLKINYDDVIGQEFDSRKVKCNSLLTRSEAKEDLLWLAAVEGDKDTLDRNVDHVFDWLGKHNHNKGMGFFVTRKDYIKEDQLRALFVSSLGALSDASGSNGLSSYAFFLRVE